MLSSKDSDLSSSFDKNAESPLNDKNPLKQLLYNNHGDEANKGKNEGQLPQNGFCKSFKK